ncbi:hypothetical protein [Desulfobacter curvatus]|uniref:hypothetical protein n=1 Tax=Desulfobacter curvatus TaxID=2290 RepID=UPI0012F7908B|nr:hypothetical protein [Desulfobacter curvatus]
MLKTTYLIISAVYEKNELNGAKNGNVSIKKLFSIAFILNFGFVVGLLLLGRFSQEEEIFGISIHGSFQFLFILMFLIPITVGLEFLSYKITKYFYKKAIKNSSYKFILVDTFILCFLYYCLPIILVVSCGFISIKKLLPFDIGPKLVMSSFLVFLGMPTGPITTNLLVEVPLYVRLIMLPPCFSVCLPSLLLIISMVLLYNRRVLCATAKIMEKIDSANWHSIKNIFLSIFTIASGLVTVASYLALQ